MSVDTSGLRDRQGTTLAQLLIILGIVGIIVAFFIGRMMGDPQLSFTFTRAPATSPDSMTCIGIATDFTVTATAMHRFTGTVTLDSLTVSYTFTEPPSHVGHLPNPARGLTNQLGQHWVKIWAAGPGPSGGTFITAILTLPNGETRTAEVGPYKVDRTCN